MHKDFVPPLSIEEFAAYLDGNLSDDENKRVSSVIENDEAMQDIIFDNQSVEKVLANCESSEFALLEELISLDFEIPQFDDGTNFNNTWEELEITACAADMTYGDPSACDDYSAFSYRDENDVLHQVDSTDGISDEINNDFTRVHSGFENDVPEINE